MSRFRFGRLFNWNFTVTDASRPILGDDFLERYGLLVDIKNKKFIDFERNKTTRGHLPFVSSLGITVLSGDTQFHKLLSKFPNLTNPSLNIVSKSHGTTHRILTKGPPVFSRARRLTPEKLKAVKTEFKNFVAQDDILMASVDHASHYRDLERVFLRLNEKGLVLNIEKCILAADKLPFLGCEVSRDGISPSEEKVEALVNYLQPQDVAP
ncbi:hypothetical protein AVEN_31641-1 [Araneus ventricosus]|uniref:Reverse transcriptase domain-containing protein n=1 Tax=Araneus ventricosus TaxID=182803 RepID=A0A4Y2NXF0_ARAVE|nr:hypothetical protein AVEN_31641-1 [Araneus ventricosus]